MKRDLSLISCIILTITFHDVGLFVTLNWIFTAKYITLLLNQRSLRLQQREFDGAITELEQKASEEAVTNGMLEKMYDLARRHQEKALNNI